MANEAGDVLTVKTFFYGAYPDPNPRHRTISTYDAAGRLISPQESYDCPGGVPEREKDKGPEPDSDSPIIV